LEDSPDLLSGRVTPYGMEIALETKYKSARESFE